MTFLAVKMYMLFLGRGGDVGGSFGSYFVAGWCGMFFCLTLPRLGEILGGLIGNGKWCWHYLVVRPLPSQQPSYL